MKSHTQFKPSLIRLGERIYHSRILKNMATKQIASQLCLSPEAYRNIEKGITDPSFTTLKMIAEILEINCTDLIQDI